MDDLTKKFGRIGVLMGGCSSERDISLKSGKAVCTALKEAGCAVSAFDIDTTQKDQIVSLLKQESIDIVFIALHGEFGEDGTIQSILDEAEIIYTGSGPEACSLAMNKIATQQLLKSNGIAVAPYEIINKNDSSVLEDVVARLGGLPVVVKPACGGSSIGISLIRKPDELSNALDEAFQLGSQILVERYIHGREMTVGILAQEALPVIEIKPGHAFFDFTAKYEEGKSDYIVPAKLDQAAFKNIQDVALKVHHLLGCRDFSRADFILDETNTPYHLELNAIPGFTKLSLLPMAAKEIGCDYAQMCLKVLELANERKSSKMI